MPEDLTPSWQTDLRSLHVPRRDIVDRAQVQATCRIIWPAAGQKVDDALASGGRLVVARAYWRRWADDHYRQAASMPEQGRGRAQPF